MFKPTETENNRKSITTTNSKGTKKESDVERTKWKNNHLS